MAVPVRAQVDLEIVERYLPRLAEHGGSGVCRAVYAQAWVAATEQYAAWCQEADPETWRDAVENVWGRLEGSQGGLSIVSRSHIDSLKADSLAIVPDSSTLTIDVRHPNPDQRRRLYDCQERLMPEVAVRHGPEIDWPHALEMDPVICPPGLISSSEQATRELGVRSLTMTNGASHDVQQMAKKAHVAMIFCAE